MASREYDRLMATAEEGERLRNELGGLQKRLSALEGEVRRLGGLLPE